MKVQFILLLGILATLSLAQDCNVSNNEKLDCGYLGITEQQCESKGCCWQPQGTLFDYIQQYFYQFKNLIFGEQKIQNGDSTPWCFYDADVCNSFNLSSDDSGFTKEWYEGMYDKFMENINVVDNGAVCAAPDTNTPGGSYYYHWMRDAALSMRTYMELNDYDYQSIKHTMNKYVSWVSHVQHEYDPNGNSVLVEPKFVIPTRKPYTGGWCRPQTDGPGLRSATLIQYANVILQEGQEVSDEIWEAIKTDLGWVNSNWQDNGCDLWEEVQSTDFFWNRMAFYQSLTWGSQLATTLGDENLAETWAKTAANIKPTLLSHWNGSFIYESTNREQDSAVIHALANLNEDIFSISGKETAATISTYSKSFCAEYPINKEDDSNGTPGILFGRYPGDIYAGGNPWQLLSASLAEVFYKGAEASLAMEHEYVPEEHLVHWRNLMKLPSKVKPTHLAAAQKKAGNAVMYRIWVHVQDTDSFSLYEQIDKNNGQQMSAKDLTWSFANVLRNLHFYVFNDTYQAKFQKLEKNIEL